VNDLYPSVSIIPSNNNSIIVVFAQISKKAAFIIALFDINLCF